MGRRAIRASPFVPVTWRDGVHLTGSPIWCDARRRRDLCFLSSSERVGRTGHGQLIGTPLALALLGTNEPGNLAVPVRQRFTLGTSRLELIPSGRGLGAAALHVDIAGRTVLYAGPVRTVTGGAGDPAEVRTCDAVVVAAPYGGSDKKFPALDELAALTIEWARARLADGVRPVLVVDTPLDGLEIAIALAAHVPIAGSRSLREAASRVGTLHAVPEIRTPGRELAAIIQVETDRLPKRPAERVMTALVSGRALGGHAGFDLGVAWANAADRTQLLGWIEATGARDVYITGACATAIAAALGPRARVLGPPHQMTLFPGEGS